MLVGFDTLFILLLLSIAFDISLAGLLTDIPKNNPLGIDWSPAPLPPDGPPLSAGATRDKSLLPAQISGIVGAYILCVLVVGIGLFLVGRRNRREILAAEKALDIEMLESRIPPPINTHNPPLSPPLSPRNFSRPSWPVQENKVPTPYVFPGRPSSPRSPASPHSPQTPESYQNVNVDARIVERDQHMLQRDLEDIYAHVMEQEEAKAAGIEVKSLPAPSHLQTVGPISQSPPQTMDLPQKKIEKRRPANIDVPEESKVRSRSSSIFSSLMSPKKSKNKLRISSPMASPRRWESGKNDTEEDSEPLTPRYYMPPPPPPPVPKDQVASYHTRQTSDLKSPTKTIAEHLGSYGVSGPTSLHHRQNQSQGSFSSQGQRERELEVEPNSAASATSTTPFTRNLPFRQQEPTSAISATSTTPFNNSSRQLPFRQFEPSLTSPSYSSFAQSTKTTILERTERPRGPQTGGLNSPFTAGAVPYSPYQPFTPMIPITPRLVTREERKMKERIAKRAGPSTPREMVKSEDDLWDSGY